MDARLLLLILIFTVSLSALAGDDFRSERDGLYEKALLDGEFDGSMLIRSLFDADMLAIDMCDMMSEAFAGEEFECDLEPEFSIEGINVEGRETLMSASAAYEIYQLDLLDEEARLFVSFCETGVSDPNTIASEISEIQRSIYELEVQFYERVLGELDESDVHHLETHNLEVYGIARPSENAKWDEIEEVLASRFPQEYREAHLQNCVAAIENKGLPFRRFRREPYREDCERRSQTYGANGETIVSTALSTVDGCVTTEYFAQKPERPGDKEIEYE